MCCSFSFCYKCCTEAARDASNFITQEDVKCICRWRFMNHQQTLNDAQKHSLEEKFWILLGRENIFLDQE